MSISEELRQERLALNLAAMTSLVPGARVQVRSHRTIFDDRLEGQCGTVLSVKDPHTYGHPFMVQVDTHPEFDLPFSAEDVVLCVA